MRGAGVRRGILRHRRAGARRAGGQRPPDRRRGRAPAHHGARCAQHADLAVARRDSGDAGHCLVVPRHHFQPVAAGRPRHPHHRPRRVLGRVTVPARRISPTSAGGSTGCDDGWRSWKSRRTVFLRHVSHDLKTPLTAIREGAQLLGEGVPGPLNEQQKTIIGIIDQNSRRLQQLIEELINYQQAGFAASSIDPHPVALDVVCTQVLRTHRLVAAARAIRFERKLTPVLVEGDADKLRVVVDNLITNAIKFSPREGVIRVELDKRDGRAVLDVVDQGPVLPLRSASASSSRFFAARGRGAARSRAAASAWPSPRNMSWRTVAKSRSSRKARAATFASCCRSTGKRRT
jgi:hypothetical protein